MVKIENLVKRYKDKLAVDNLSMHIPEGKVIGLLGPNGAGKTTTIHAILGLVDFDHGEISIFSKPFKKYEIEIKREVGFVPQHLAIYYDMSCEENLRFFGSLYGLKGRKLSERVDQVLEIVGLEKQRKRKPDEFSGGMKRRLNIGCALLHEPRLLIMDEPTVGIDAQSRNYILDTIKSLNENGMTIIYTSHYMHEVEFLCDEAIVIDEGRVIASGDLESLKKMVSHDNVLSIDYDDTHEGCLDNLSSLKGILGIESNENAYKIVYDPDLITKNVLLREVLNSGIEITEIKDMKPTLEDVFLTLTGKSLRG
ncbi:ABC transporter ATP-binding protein [Acidaminobacter sp. JC074]|uniref:ABC transporter ATP-binding protein n=1 Tax=Acidaminobacter sp. JC074 TaxID=2530199 RepID=UPI001F0D4588|nr:ABC transporter ATP-binding protein [Acidaminobacter sp. JC074]MCH4887183.1 ABC transporter ATP-binding protein [Acidaminobacter sp. JC074]